MKSCIFLITLCLILAASVPAHACRIVPNPPITPERPVALAPIQVTSHHFTATVKDGVASTVLESVFYNPNPMVLEGTYLFPLPKGASVSQFSLWIDGKEMPAELLDADKARDLYVDIVRRMVDPGLLEFVGRETFKLRVYPLPARGSRQIKLAYQQILPIDGNLMRYVYPLTTVGNGREDTLAKVSWEVKVTSQAPIQSVFSPTHNVKVVQEANAATVSFDGTNVHPDRDFVLYLSCSMKKVDLSFAPFVKKGEPGYFLMMLSPKPKIEAGDALPKDVVFVADTSGSMVGEKMTQAQAALKYCIQQLSPEDRFNIVPFATEASRYKDELIAASRENVKAAVEFVDKEVYARGGTNIDEALTYALEMSPKAGERPFMVIFMTDGKPTIGVTDADAILARVKKANCAHLRLFAFGLGEEINTKLLDRLAEENRGTSEYVGSKEDIEIKVSSFFDKVASPVLSDVKIIFPSGEKLRVSEVYPREFPDLFNGSRITVMGRYNGSGDQAIRVTGTIHGKSQEFVFETSFPEEELTNDQVPHLWAVRKIGYLLDQIRLHGEDPELKKEVVSLAKKFGIVTPYTSYLVVEDSAQPIVRPQGPAPRFDRQFSSERPAAEAKSAIEKESGKDAVTASKDLNRMKKAESMEEGGGGEKKSIRKVAEKTFYFQDGVWYDSEYQDNAAKLPETKLEYLGKDYFELLSKEPELGKFFALGNKIVIVWKNRVYKIA